MRKIIVLALICLFLTACKKDAVLKHYPLNIAELASYWGKTYENVAHHFAGFVVDSVVRNIYKTYLVPVEDKNAPFKHYSCALQINLDKKIVSIDVNARITDAKMYVDNLAYFDKLLKEEGTLVSVQVAGDNGWLDPAIQTIPHLIGYLQKGGANAWLLQYDMEEKYSCVLTGAYKGSGNFSIKVFPLI